MGGFRKVGWVIGASSVMVVATVGLMLWRYPDNQRRLVQEEIARCKAEGIPTTKEEVDAKYRPKLEDNAAPLYDEAERAYNEWRLHNAALCEHKHGPEYYSRIYRYSPEEFAAWTKEYASLQPIFSKIDAASRKPRYWREHSFAMGGAENFGELAFLKTACRLEANAADLRAKGGDTEGAFARLQAALRIGSHAGQEPVVISWLVRTACEAICLTGLEAVLNRLALSRTALTRADHFVASLPPLPDLRMYFDDELVMSRVDFEQPPPSGGRFELLEWNIRAPTYELAILKAERRFRDGLPQNFAEYDLAQQRTSSLLDELEESHSTGDNIASIVLSPLKQAVQSYATAESRRRVTAVGLAALHAMLGAGKSPETLPSQKLSIQDPLTHQPYRYWNLKDGFCVFSAWTDGKAPVDSRRTMRVYFWYDPKNYSDKAPEA